MKKDNWRFEALARAKIVQQEEEIRVLRNIPNIEDFKPAEKIERLQNINADLLIVCKDFVAFDWENSNLHWPTIAMWIARFNKAIFKAEGRDEK